MKKTLKRLLALVLILCMSTVAFADGSADLYGSYTLDEILGDKRALKDCGAMTDKRGVEDWSNAKEVISKYIDAFQFSLTFGSYPQSGISEMTKEPIEWIILEKNGGRALLISKDILDCAPLVFGNTSKEVRDKAKTYTWETSDIREWLNNEFYNSAFSSIDKQRIIPYDLTGDNVFILNTAEATSYFNLNDTNYRWGLGFSGFTTTFAHENGNPWCGCDITSYAKNSFATDKMSKSSGGSTITYHLRDGKIPRDGIDSILKIQNLKASEKHGIRPCVWIKYDPYVTSAKSQNLANKLAGSIIGGALDGIVPGAGLLVP